MKLVVLNKMTSSYKVPIDSAVSGTSSDWQRYEFEFSKIGFLKKPEFQVKNLSISIIRQEKGFIICRTSDRLCVDLDEQKNLMNNISDEEWKVKLKEQLEFMRKNGKYIDVKIRGCAFSEFPVSANPTALMTLSDDINYHYLFSIVE